MKPGSSTAPRIRERKRPCRIHTRGGEPPLRETPSASGPEGLRRTHSAIGVAFALLDELLQLLPERPDAEALKEVDEVLREIRDLARTGLKIIKLATGPTEHPEMPGNRSG